MGGISVLRPQHLAQRAFGASGPAFLRIDVTACACAGAALAPVGTILPPCASPAPNEASSDWSQSPCACAVASAAPPPSLRVLGCWHFAWWRPRPAPDPPASVWVPALRMLEVRMQTAEAPNTATQQRRTPRCVVCRGVRRCCAVRTIGSELGRSAGQATVTSRRSPCRALPRRPACPRVPGTSTWRGP